MNLKYNIKMLLFIVLSFLSAFSISYLGCSTHQACREYKDIIGVVFGIVTVSFIVLSEIIGIRRQRHEQADYKK